MYSNFFYKSILLLIFIFVTNICQTLTQYRGVSSGHGHGSFCNSTQKCNSLALLTCQENSCQCILPDSMIFVPKNGSMMGKCVSLVQEACGKMSMDSSEVSLKCVDHAFCNGQGECECSAPFYKAKNGHCDPKKGFGVKCNKSLECSQSLGLSCVDHTCQCNSSVSIDSLKFFDMEESEDENGNDGQYRHFRRCLGKPGQPCLNGLNEECVPNALCTNSDNEGDIGNKSGNKICQCQSGFEESKSKKVCLGTFNKTCDTQSNHFCVKNLVCMNSVCTCSSPSDQVYNILPFTLNHT